ncbi:hypothetical protein KKP04_08485 [Rhodomicrobium sp. Az07]|uniref:hypothetical protein n=1 Tax=Rhodomicrobium sp. Az07 TaxID=2839034 RepID=UPI001BEBE12B|nr:hypothetical protein [Rhodomicrobium sp. Az07]MBT3070902.1 hypothetical protein [Rhodomicrobium sp. Az07]
MGGTDNTRFDANSQNEAGGADPSGQARAPDEPPLATAPDDAVLVSQPDAPRHGEPPVEDGAPPPASPAHQTAPSETPVADHEPSLSDEAATRQGPPPEREVPPHEPPPAGAPDLILDERLTSAAAPFLYLLGIVMLAVAGYLVYLFL